MSILNNEAKPWFETKAREVFRLYDKDKEGKETVRTVYDWHLCEGRCGNYVRPNKQYCCTVCRDKPLKHKSPFKTKHYRIREDKNE